MHSTPRYLASFDSATALARALSCSLDGGTYRPMGRSRLLRAGAVLANRMPRRLRERIYAWRGHVQSVGDRDLQKLDPERISRWVCGLYPRRRYPALFVGSSNGAAIHLAAAFGVPWLPQTVLIPVRHAGCDPDDARGQIEAVRPLGLRLLRQHDDLVLHHMHDPNQDRLMVQYMAYFRVKRRRLGTTYDRFIERALSPEATIFVLDCRASWPVTTVAPRYFFQHGGVGGTTPREMVHGSARVTAFLARERASRQRWDPPPADHEEPEAEWGYRHELDDDIARAAERGGHRVVRIAFDDPDDLSPLVADLLAWWHERCGGRPDTLLIDSFILLEPALARRMGAVPFWTKFSVESSLAAADAYIGGRTTPFKRIGLTLFAHGVDSIGFASAERWSAMAAAHAQHCRFLGVDPAAHPADLAIYFRYADALTAFRAATVDLPPIPIKSFRAFCERNATRYRVRIAF